MAVALNSTPAQGAADSASSLHRKTWWQVDQLSLIRRNLSMLSSTATTDLLPLL